MLYIGFEVNFSFIKHEAFRGLTLQQFSLYKYMFAPDLQPQTLAIIGCVAPRGPVQPVLEMQGRFAARVLKVDMYGNMAMETTYIVWNYDDYKILQLKVPIRAAASTRVLVTFYFRLQISISGCNFSRQLINWK